MGDLVANSISDSYPKPDFFEQKNKTQYLSNVGGLFVGFSPKSSESDSVRSPTSPLDFWVFTNLANPFVKSPKSPHIKWGSSKVGLSIIESLDDINTKQLSNTRNILTKNPFLHSSADAPKSLPKNYGVFTFTQIKPSKLQKGSSSDFKIGGNPYEAESFGNFRSCSLDSGKSRLTNLSINSSFENFGSKTRMSPLGSNPKLITNKNQVLPQPSAVSKPVCSALDFIGSLSAGEIELSEDYTCVKTFGPNPKTTHIFGDYVFKCHHSNVTDLSCIKEQKIKLEAPNSSLPSDFLSLCYYCKKKLEGKDIYMYRGEKAFCSPDCRSYEISLDEDREKKASVPSPKSSSSKPNNAVMFFIG